MSLTVRCSLSADWGWPSGPTKSQAADWAAHAHAFVAAMCPPHANVRITLVDHPRDSVSILGTQAAAVESTAIVDALRAEWERWVRTL